MKYLYTSKPDEHCHEIDGVYGRPVHQHERLKLIKAGWRATPQEVAPVEVKEEAPQDEDEELAEARAQYEELFGEKPHHKAKLETIRTKIEEKLND